jgi:hypothetical protein
MERFSYIFFIVVLIGVARFWLTAWRLYGVFLYRMGWKMWQIQSCSWRGFLMSLSLYFALFYILKETIWTSLSNMLPPIPICFVLAGVFAFVGYSCLPPRMLFLAASRPEQRSLALEMIRAVSPGRVVFLLSDDFSMGIYQHDDFSRNNLRTAKDVDWRDVVHPLFDMVPLVVIDTRVTTPPVSEELVRILSTSSSQKTLFVVDDRGESPVLDQTLQTRNSTLPIIRICAGQIVSVVRKIVK